MGNWNTLFLSLGFYFAFVIGYFAPFILAPRLRDIGLSPWFSAIALFGPIVCVITLTVLFLPSGWWSQQLKERICRSKLFGRRVQCNSSMGVIFWWEKRRIIFNLLVGASGLITFAVMTTMAFISESKGGEPIGMSTPLFEIAGIFFYGVMANVCFTFGWVAELLVRKIRPIKARDFGVYAYFLGTVSSICLTLSPLVIFGPIGLIIVAKLYFSGG